MGDSFMELSMLFQLQMLRLTVHFSFLRDCEDIRQWWSWLANTHSRGMMLQHVANSLLAPSIDSEA